jgi:AhpD family alkylhydroperoxidase
MDEKTKLLIAIGAAVACNCQPCLDHLHDLAPLSNATTQELQEAINIAKTVRDGAASAMGEFASSLFGKEEPSNRIKKNDYGCGCM